MLKHIRLILGLFSFVVLLSSCGKDKEPPEPVDIPSEMVGSYTGIRVYEQFGLIFADTIDLTVTKSFKQNTMVFEETPRNNQVSYTYDVLLTEQKSNAATFVIDEQIKNLDILRGQPLFDQQADENIHGIYLYENTENPNDPQTITYNLRIVLDGTTEFTTDYEYSFTRN